MNPIQTQQISPFSNTEAFLAAQADNDSLLARLPLVMKELSEGMLASYLTYAEEDTALPNWMPLKQQQELLRYRTADQRKFSTLFLPSLSFSKTDEKSYGYCYSQTIALLNLFAMTTHLGHDFQCVYIELFARKFSGGSDLVNTLIQKAHIKISSYLVQQEQNYFAFLLGAFTLMEMQAKCQLDAGRITDQECLQKITEIQQIVNEKFTHFQYELWYNLRTQTSFCSNQFGIGLFTEIPHSRAPQCHLHDIFAMLEQREHCAILVNFVLEEAGHQTLFLKLSQVVYYFDSNIGLFKHDGTYPFLNSNFVQEISELVMAMERMNACPIKIEAELFPLTLIPT